MGASLASLFVLREGDVLALDDAIATNRGIRDSFTIIFKSWSPLDAIAKKVALYMKVSEHVDLAAILAVLPYILSTEMLESLDCLDTEQFLVFFSHYVLDGINDPSLPSVRAAVEICPRILTDPTGTLRPAFEPSITVDGDNVLIVLLKQAAKFSFEREHAIVDQVFQTGSSPDLNDTRSLAHALIDSWRTMHMIKMIRALMSAGVSPNPTDEQRKSALDVAYDTNQLAIAAYLAEYGAEGSSPLHNAYENIVTRMDHILQTFARKCSLEDRNRLFTAALEEASMILFWILTYDLKPVKFAQRTAAATAAAADGSVLPSLLSLDLNQRNPATGEYPLMTLFYYPDRTPRPDSTGIRISICQHLLAFGVRNAIGQNLITGRPENLLMRVIEDGNTVAMHLLATIPEMATFRMENFDSPLKRLADCFDDFRSAKAYVYQVGFREVFERDPKLLEIEAGHFLYPVAKSMLKSGADPNMKHRHDDLIGTYMVPIIFEFIRLGISPIVGDLLDAGADPNTRTQTSTAIEFALANREIAIRNGHGSYSINNIITDLVKHGAILPPRSAADVANILLKTWNKIWHR